MPVNVVVGIVSARGAILAADHVQVAVLVDPGVENRDIDIDRVVTIAGLGWIEIGIDAIGSGRQILAGRIDGVIGVDRGHVWILDQIVDRRLTKLAGKSVHELGVALRDCHSAPLVIGGGGGIGPGCARRILKHHHQATRIEIGGRGRRSGAGRLGQELIEPEKVRPETSVVSSVRHATHAKAGRDKTMDRLSGNNSTLNKSTTALDDEEHIRPGPSARALLIFGQDWFARFAQCL